MAETKKKSIVFVVALIVLAAMIVVVATALSGCSGNDNSADLPAPWRPWNLLRQKKP